MMTCPRCGFVQPKDRFCAQCGLDSERYKPSPKPILERVVSNSLVQIVAIVTLVAGTAYVMYLRKKSGIIPETVTTAASTNPPSAVKPATAEPAAKPQPEPIKKTEEASNSADASGNPGQQIQNEITEKAKPLNAAVADTGEEPAKEETKKPALSSLKVAMLSVPASQLPALTEGAKSVGSSGTMKAFWFKNWSATVQKLRDARGVDMADLDSGQISGNQSGWDRMVMDPFSNQPIGISLDLAYNPADPAKFAIKVERFLRDGKGPQNREIVNWSLDNLVISQAGEALFITGVLPHRKLSRDEEMLFAPTSLRVMALPEFQEGLLDVGLLVEPLLQP